MQSKIFYKSNYHFSRLSQQPRCIFTMTALSRESIVIWLSWYLHLQLSRDPATLVSFKIRRYKFASGAIYLTLWNRNCLSKHCKDQSIWTRPKYKYKVSSCMKKVVELILDLISIMLVFYHKYWAFRIILVYIPYFSFLLLFFYQKIIIPNKINIIIDILSF